MKRRHDTASVGATLLLIDMLLNLVVLLVVIANVIAARNRVRIAEVVETVNVEVDAQFRLSIHTDVSSELSSNEIVEYLHQMIVIDGVMNRTMIPRPIFEITGPSGSFVTDGGAPQTAGAAGFMWLTPPQPSVRDDGHIWIRYSGVVLGAQEGRWSVRAILPDVTLWQMTDPRMYSVQITHVFLRMSGSDAVSLGRNLDFDDDLIDGVTLRVTPPVSVEGEQ